MQNLKYSEKDSTVEEALEQYKKDLKALQDRRDNGQLGMKQVVVAGVTISVFESVLIEGHIKLLTYNIRAMQGILNNAKS